jgi:phage gpG-like protein
VPTPDAAVRVDGLAQLRRDLRKMQPDTLKEVRGVLKHSAEIVAATARARAPRRTGRLAASIRATTAGNRAVVRSPLPYAAVHEFGGTIRPRGAPIRIRRSEMVTGALERNRDRIANALLDGLDDVARRHGWH